MSKIILIAEDYDDARAYMVFLMKSYGYEVCDAANGLKAIELVKERYPNLILMDISMPVMDSLEATRIIRKSDDSIANVPIIAISAFGNDYKEHSIKAGCNHFISKPVDFDKLETVIKQYLVN